MDSPGMFQARSLLDFAPQWRQQVSLAEASKAPVPPMQRPPLARALEPAGSMFDDDDEDDIDDFGIMVGDGKTGRNMEQGAVEEAIERFVGQLPPHGRDFSSAGAFPRVAHMEGKHSGDGAWRAAFVDGSFGETGPAGASQPARRAGDSLSGAVGSAFAVPTPEDTTPWCTGETRTTVVLQVIPEALDDFAFRKELDELGFAGLYDAVYVPMKTSKCGRNQRYAFVNFALPRDAAECIMICNGKPFGSCPEPGRACIAQFAHVQGAAYTESRLDCRVHNRRRSKNRGGDRGRM